MINDYKVLLTFCKNYWRICHQQFHNSFRDSFRWNPNTEGPHSRKLSIIGREEGEPGPIHCYKSNNNFRDITWNVEKKNVILHEIFREVSRFPSYISCNIAESQLPLGQCILHVGDIQEMGEVSHTTETLVASHYGYLIIYYYRVWLWLLQTVLWIQIHWIWIRIRIHGLIVIEKQIKNSFRGKQSS